MCLLGKYTLDGYYEQDIPLYRMDERESPFKATSPLTKPLCPTRFQRIIYNSLGKTACNQVQRVIDLLKLFPTMARVYNPPYEHAHPHRINETAR